MEIAISLWHLIGRSLQDVGCNSHGQSFGSYGCMVLVTFKSLFFVEQIKQFDSATLWLTSWMGRYTMHIHHCNGPSFPSFPSFPIHELSQEICCFHLFSISKIIHSFFFFFSIHVSSLLPVHSHASDARTVAACYCPDRCGAAHIPSWADFMWDPPNAIVTILIASPFLWVIQYTPSPYGTRWILHYCVVFWIKVEAP